MRVGITLPQFRHDPEPAIEVARRAEAVGLDGVFVFDHLWRIGHPDEPALHGLTLLAALAVETSLIRLGSLVSRIGLLPDAVLVHTLVSLQRVAGGRLVAGLGVGDRASRAENLAYGVPFGPPDERRAALAGCCRGLRARGVETWVGGLSPATRALGRAEADAVNLWGVDVHSMASEVAAAEGTEVTWGGQVDVSDSAGAAALLRGFADAGAAWAVAAPVGVPWPEAVDATIGAVAALS